MSAELPLLSTPSSQPTATPKNAVVSAASLLALSKGANSPASPYRTLSRPIDRVAGPFLRRGYGLQISGPPGTCVEQLVLGLLRSVTAAREEAVLVDARTERVHYCVLHKLHDVVEFLTTTLPSILTEKPKISLLVLSSLSFPYQAEGNYSTRTALLERVRELIIKLCKRNQLVTVITASMSTQFVNPDGSRATFRDYTKGIMNPQIDLQCKSISSLILSRDDRKSGRATLTPATGQDTIHAEFDFAGLEIVDKVP